MKIRFSIPAKWSPEYQQQVHGQIERAFDGIREYAIPPAGGAAGQVLTKSTATDYDFAWLNPGALTADYLPRTTNTWQQSTDGKSRFFFGTNGRTYFGSPGGYEWRSAADATLMTLTDSGSLSIAGGTNTPLELRTSSSSPWALNLTRTDIGNTISVYNNGGMWHFSAPVNAASYLYVNGKQAIDGTDSWLRLNQSGNFSSGIYTPGALRADGGISSSGGVIQTSGDMYVAGGYRWQSDTSFYIYNTSGYTYGSWRIGGARNSYVGLMLDIGNSPTLMSSGGNTIGVYMQSAGFWSWYDNGSAFQIQNRIIDSSSRPYIKHAAAYGSAAITVSTSAPSGGSDGDIWLKV